jgi:DUF1680 family protein
VPGKFEGIYFNDSDVYKVLEGAAYSLADQPDAALAKATEDVIAKIAAAQKPDGYLNTYYTLAEPGKRWSNLSVMHELYCAGHMIEGAVAHYRTTGRKTFLDVAMKYADLINETFGPGKKPGICGHEEIELALVKLYQVSGEKRYLELAKRMLELRGDKTQRPLWGEYCQDHIPVRQQREIVGHAVRAMYLYSGVADVASYTGDAGFIEAMDALWQDVVLKKMYITGGVGAKHEGEAFGARYELPNDSAYCETCAAIGLVFWAHRMNLLHGDAQYADVMERALYNGVLSGIALGGEQFFYVNPLSSAGNHHRQPFYDCACCPSNVVRLVPSIPGYQYAVGEGAVFVNLYAAGKATATLDGVKVKLTQATNYPWDGKVTLTVEPEKAAQFTLCLRVPGWCREAKAAVKLAQGNDAGKQESAKGYCRISRTWQPGDRVEFEMAMPVERIEAHPLVKADAGRVALQRGPIVYAFEAVDNGGPVRNLVLAKEQKFETEHKSDLLGGVSVVKAQTRQGKIVTAIPYYAWDHRTPGEMVVWVLQDGKSRNPAADDPAWQGKLYRPLDPKTLGASAPAPLAEQATAKVSYCDKFGGTPTALNDGIEPKDSCDHNVPRLTWYEQTGKQWVEYHFDAPRKVSAAEVYWFDDGKVNRHCRVPKTWKLLYRDGDAWKEVPGPSAYGVTKDKFNPVTFGPVTTTGLRIEAELAAPNSGGILEWKVK